MEKLKSSVKVIVESGNRIVPSFVLSNILSTNRYPLFVTFYFLLFTFYFPNSVFAQQPARDSLRILQHNIDSLLKADSIESAVEEARFQRTRQVASQRFMQMTEDTAPEVLRLSGYVPKEDVGKTKLTFTIKSGKRTLFEDSWLAEGYFDTLDHLPDSVKLHRLRNIVTVFFANENFSVVDSNDFNEMMSRVTQADIAPHSSEAKELFQKPRVMYSVFHSRDYWYGLIWDPKKEKFVKPWRN